MNILFISHYAGSPDMGMVFRTYYFAKEWVKQGHSVSIVTASFTHIRKSNPIISKDFEEFDIDGIRYIWIKTPTYKNSIQRVFNIFTFVFKLNAKVKYLSCKYCPDIVISSSTYNFDIFPAIKLAKYSNAKLVYEVRDLWPLTPIELGGFSKYHPFIMLMQYAENTAYKKANKVISVLPCVHNYMMEHGLELHKLEIIPNGVDKDDWACGINDKLDPSILSFILDKKKKDFLLIGYVGQYNNANALEYFLESVSLLRNRSIFFIMIGNGSDKKNILNYISLNKMNNIVVFDSIPKSHVPYILTLFDVLYKGSRNVPLYRFGISPTKLMDYMMAGRPILHSVKSGNDPVMEAGCGITVEPENPEAIADGILKLAALTPEERDEMGKRGRDYILKNQTYDILAKKFLDFVTKDN